MREFERLSGCGRMPAIRHAARLLKESGGSLRRVSTNLSHVKETAITLGLTKVGISEWGARPFFRGEAPPPRREHSVERSRQQQAARTARRA